MKRSAIAALLLIATATSVGFGMFDGPGSPTMLSFRIGQEFQDVVAGSTYPVMTRSAVPEGSIGAGETFVTEPAVTLRFNDPDHGFVLPPTKFAVVGYNHNKVSTVATSPMLDKLPFDHAVAILEDVQRQLQVGGWEPWERDESAWFDLTPAGKKRLYARMFEDGFAQQAILRVPNQYSMILRLWCSDGCMTGRPPYLFMIDVGVGSDVYGEIEKLHR